MLKGFLTPAEVGKLLGLPPETVQRYLLNAKQGKTPAIHGEKFSCAWLVLPSAVERYRQERRSPGRPKQNRGKRRNRR